MERENDFLVALYREDPSFPMLYRVGISTGLRISDLLRLRAGDVSSSPIRVVEQKTGNIRKIDIPPSIRTELALFCDQHKNYDLIWHTSRQTVWRAYKAAGEAIGLSGIGTHSMRKTYALRRVMSGSPIGELQKDFGHKYTATTMLYCLNRAGEWAAVNGSVE